MSNTCVIQYTFGQSKTKIIKLIRTYIKITYAQTHFTYATFIFYVPIKKYINI